MYAEKEVHGVVLQHIIRALVPPQSCKGKGPPLCVCGP